MLGGAGDESVAAWIEGWFWGAPELVVGLLLVGEERIGEVLIVKRTYHETGTWYACMGQRESDASHASMRGRASVRCSCALRASPPSPSCIFMAALQFLGSSHFRQRIICSTLSSKPVVITEIRASKAKPGLQGNHSTSTALFFVFF